MLVPWRLNLPGNWSRLLEFPGLLLTCSAPRSDVLKTCGKNNGNPPKENYGMIGKLISFQKKSMAKVCFL